MFITYAVQRGENIFCEGRKMNNGKHYQAQPATKADSFDKVTVIQLVDNATTSSIRFIKTLQVWFEKRQGEPTRQRIEQEICHPNICKQLMEFNNICFKLEQAEREFRVYKKSRRDYKVKLREKTTSKEKSKSEKGAETAKKLAEIFRENNKFPQQNQTTIAP